MTTHEHARWNGLEVRRPDDVRTSQGVPVPIGWQADKRAQHTERLGNNLLPADFPYDVERGDAGDALAALALGESMRRDLGYERGIRIRTAMELGSTWRQVADALDVTPDEARGLLREWAYGQHHLYRGDIDRGEVRPLGMDGGRYAGILALCALEDDVRASGDATPAT